MKVYLLSAAGVIFLSVVVSLLIPEGKLHKSIMFIMRLICIFVLIQPVAGIFKIGGGDGDSAQKENFIDYTYVSSVYSEHQGGELEKLIKKDFGIEVVCSIKVEHIDGNFKVTETEVRLAQNNAKLIDDIYAYLVKLGYINITVYAQST